MDRSEFSNPGTEYGGVTLWMLNDKLEREEIARQLKGLHAAGWGAVITRTFNGLRTEYLSDEWMDITQDIIDGAKEYGMKVWLQAGYMPSGIPDLEEGQAHKVLVRKPKDEPPEDGDSLLCEDGDYAYYQRTLRTVLDLLNPEAVSEYLHKAYKLPWDDRFGDEFGKTVETIWVDEPHFRPPLSPWSDRLPELFEQQWGYSLVESLPSLFSQSGDFRKVRHHYWRTVLEMLLSGYFEPVGRWCEEHGVKFSGHLMGEDTLNAQIGWTASAMPCYEYMQLPGIDHLTLSMRWPSGNNFVLTPKQCSSAANQLGWKEILSEMYGVSSQGITFEDRKWIGDWIEQLGINYRCYHGSFYSLRGRRKRIYAPHLSYQQPWWPDNRLVSDYFTRLSYTLRQGQYRADVLVLHPVESGFCAYDPTFAKEPHDRINEPPEIRALNGAFSLLGDNLLKIQRGFEYGDEHLMARYGKVTKEGLSVGQMTYKVVILPSVITLRKSTVELLSEFIESGGAVLSVGELPSRIDGTEDEAIDNLNAKIQKLDNSPPALKQALNGLTPAGIEIVADESDAENIWVHERQMDGSRLFFLCNPTRTEAVEAEVRIRGAGKLECWDLRTGDVGTIPQRHDGEFTVTRLSFPPVASHLLVLNENEEPADVPEEERAVSRTYELSGDYRIRRHSPNALTLDFCRFRKGEGDWSELLPVIAVQELLGREEYEGPVTLQFRVVTETKPGSIQVVIEDAEEFDIKVNGETVKHSDLPYYVDKAFHPVDVSGQVRAGENLIEISRHFQPPVRPKFGLASLWQTATGVELESVYLTGDFAVKGAASAGEQHPRCVRLQPEFVLTEEAESSSGDLAAGGYPFFVGTISLTNTIGLAAPQDDEQVFLTLPGLDAVLAKVRINGKDAGAILWAPYEVEITSLVQDGDNEVEIELTTSLRNLLGPHHRPTGEPDDCWGDDWSARASAADWYTRRDDEDVAWTDDYFVLHLGVRGKAQIEYRSSGSR